MYEPGYLYNQDPPYAIQISATEGCNLRCDFCGLNGIREPKNNDFKFLTLKLATKIATDIYSERWKSRIEFAGHGEPTKNPNLVAIIAQFRELLPNNPLMLTTNGSGFLGDTSEIIQRYFNAGLNTIALDQYEGIPWADIVRKKLAETPLTDVDFHEYPSDKKGNPHQRSKRRRMIIISPINLNTSGTHADLNNHCGAGSPPSLRGRGKRCAKPFREIHIRWNGKIAICCNDWRGVLKMGDVGETSLSDIWQNEIFQAARKKLLHYDRGFDPCNICDAKSYRVGLLPDTMGKETLPRPSAKDEAILKAAASGPSYTAPVKRPWELVNISKPKSLIE